MEYHNRIYARIVNATGLRQWFVKTSEGHLGPYASWQESRSNLDQHLRHLEQTFQDLEESHDEQPLGA